MAEEASCSSHSVGDSSSSTKKHHKQSAWTYNRPKYREARWERAVKVYTINLESKYVLVQGIPAVGATKELLELFAIYGAIDEYRILDEYPTEPFTEVYWIKFQRINSARVAKKKLDDKSFFGGILHVCYAPEFETVDDTREKLQERRKVIAKKTRELFGVQPKATTVSRDKDTSLKRSAEEDNDSTNESCVEKHRVQSTADQSSSTTEVPSSYSFPLGNSMPYTMPLSSTYDYPTLPHPPQHLHPYQYPPPPPPWEFPLVPSSHATLPAYLQTLPSPPPPPPPPPPTPPAEVPKQCERAEQEKPFTVYMSQVTIGPQPEPGVPSNKDSLTGDHSLDQTAISIRNKMQKLTRAQEVSPPAAQNFQATESPRESAAVTVTKKKRKRI